MIYQTDIKSHDGLRYQVQARQRSDGAIEQRHIWHHIDNLEGPWPWVQKWIPAASRSLESATKYMKPAPDAMDEWGEAIAALRDIAAGDNDARSRAQKALSMIEKTT
jgi:hypothetical protein